MYNIIPLTLLVPFTVVGSTPALRRGTSSTRYIKDDATVLALEQLSEMKDKMSDLEEILSSPHITGDNSLESNDYQALNSKRRKRRLHSSKTPKIKLCVIDDYGGVEMIEIKEDSFEDKIEKMEDGTYFFPTTYYKDDDDDGYGNEYINVTQCFTPLDTSFVDIDGDCDDTNSQVHPSALEICFNGIDDDCNTETPDDVSCFGFARTLNESFVPLCKKDSRGYPLSPSDPDYDSAILEYSEGTQVYEIIEEADILGSAASSILSGVFTAAGTLTFYRALVYENLLTVLKLPDRIQCSGLNACTKALSTIGRTKKVFRRLSALSYAFPALAIGIEVADIFGVFGPSETEQVLSAISEGFNQMHQRFDELTEIIRESLKELQRFITDVELDAIASKTQSLLRAYQHYAQSTSGNTTDSNTTTQDAYLYEQLYTSRFTQICNDPEYIPENIFYDVYGYACTNCTKAPQKRADFLTQFKDFADFSATKFSASFGNFIITQLIQCLFLHIVCPPLIEIPCSDGSDDEVWEDTLVGMFEALEEVAETLDAISPELDSQWVQFLSNDDIKDKIVTLASTETDLNLQRVADYLFEDLSTLHPEYLHQVIVYQDSAYIKAPFIPFVDVYKFNEFDESIDYHAAQCDVSNSDVWTEPCVDGAATGFKTFSKIDISDILGSFADSLVQGDDALLVANPQISVMIRFIYNSTYVDASSGFNSTNATSLIPQTEPEDEYGSMIGGDVFVYIVCGFSNDCTNFHYSYGESKLTSNGYFLASNTLLNGIGSGGDAVPGAIEEGTFGQANSGSQYFPSKIIKDNWQDWLVYY